MRKALLVVLVLIGLLFLTFLAPAIQNFEGKRGEYIGFFVVGCILFGTGLAGLYNIYQANNGQGLPATKEQEDLIGFYFQQLGEFYTPSKHLTQGEARDILKDLEARLPKKDSDQ